MTSRRLCVAAAVTLCALFCAGVALADPKGLWLAQDGAHVKVGPCGVALCATIATPKSAYDPETGRPWTDKHNPDPAQRGRPLRVSLAMAFCSIADRVITVQKRREAAWRPKSSC